MHGIAGDRQRGNSVWVLLAAGVSLLLAWAAVRADVVVRNDGTRVEGDIQRVGDNFIVRTPDGQEVTIPTSDVKTIELRRGPATATSSEALASLRRSGDAATDPKRMVDRYRQFVEMNRGTPVEADARMDLAVWEDRLNRGMVKIGPKWLDRAEAETVRGAATETALAAIVALRESRFAEAEAAIQDALAADPTNPTALYLRGILQYRNDRFLEARRSFEAALAIAPNHGPTLANLAVVTSRLNQWGVALNMYDQTLIVMPLEKGLLNNVAEFLQLLPNHQRGLTLTKRVERKLTEQETLLAQRLAPQGIYRWGATWVDQKQMDQIRAAEKEQRAQLDLLAGQYDKLISRVSAIDGQLRQIDNDIRAIEASSFSYGPNGEIVRLPLPASYYTLKQQQQQLVTERQDVLRQQAQVRDRARAVQKTSPVPKYTGIQQLYAAEAAPVPVPPPGQMSPATQPSGQR